MPRIYADAAASTPLSHHVWREMRRLAHLCGNPGGLHKEAVAAKRELERARARVASAIGAHPDEIFFVSGGTEANNLAIIGSLRPLLATQGECNALTLSIEHSSVLEPLRALEREGLYTIELAVGEGGVLEPSALREALSQETALLSVQMVNSEVGAVQDIRALAKEIRHARGLRSEKGIVQPLIFHCDASQAPLWLPLKVDSLGVDLMTLDGQKICGPKGVGVLYVRRGTPLEPLMHGGGQEQGLRSGTESVVLAGAFAAALEDAQNRVHTCAPNIAAVRDLCIQDIRRLIPNAVLNGPSGEARIANNINVSIPGLDGEMAALALDARGIAVSTRSACDTDEEAPSHVLAALGVSPKRAREAVRITFLPTATKRQARRIARELARAAGLYANFMEER